MVPCNWIGRQITYLTGQMGVYRLEAGSAFFFEPTPGFYGFIAQGTTEALNDAMGMLARHIESPTAPVIEKWKGSAAPLVASDYDPTASDEAPGLIRYCGPYHSRIQLAIENMHSPLVMGAILAHELTHHFLAIKSIGYVDENENERLTDFATAYLGLGKLTLNGYDPIEWSAYRQGRAVTYSYRVGYLTCADMAAAVSSVCRLRHLPIGVARANLSQKAARLLHTAQLLNIDYERKKMLVAERRCPRCGQLTRFDFGNDDDEVYCKSCGWGWNAILEYSYKERQKARRRWWMFWRR